MSAQVANHQRSSPTQLPEEEIAEQLRQWWSSEVEPGDDDPFAKKKETNKGTLYDLVVEIDSLSVTNALVIVESIIGFEVPVKLIKRGGYRDCEEMINHLLAGLRECAQRGTLTHRRKEKKHAIRIKH